MIPTHATSRIVVSFGIAALILVGFVCVSFADMKMQMDDIMSHCPLMPGTTVCIMTPLEHLTAWQSIFRILPLEKDFSLVFFIMFIMTLFTRSGVKFFLPHLRIVYARNTLSYQQYIPLHSFLQEAFASGILNSRIS